MGSLKELEPSVDEALKVLLTQLAKTGSKPIDMGLWAQLFAFGRFIQCARVLTYAHVSRCHWTSYIFQIFQFS